MLRWLMIACTCSAVALANELAAAADVYPAKLVKIVVPFAAGGSTDLLTRSVAQQLNEAWKRPVVVENRAGGGGIVGSEYVVKSPPDGYVLLLGTNTTHAAAATLYAKLPYDLRRDFAPITEIASIPLILSVHPSIPVKSVKELVALAKAQPGQLNFGGGTGAAAHMAMALFESMAKIDMVHVPYKGSGPAMIDLLGGHLSLGFDAVMTTLPYAQTGKLRMLAVSSLKRSAVAPQVPTMAESGYPGYEAILWFGLFAPAGTPADIVKKINEETGRSVATPRMRELLASQGLEIVASSPAEFTARVDREIVKWRKVILDAGIKLE
ncbi:MAG TPA: tripartite tricarboxylate transporter substrate binding protein [Burkholderiales bacterium]|jgi:tripartite-type tricarboxylate transporter receptor subunit TctC|nr:tripartite tricarboxylate transporter substrate binding protein [Burkholderiales bacterium]